MAKEAIVRLNNRTGVLAQVTKSIAEKGVNLEAVIATVGGMDAVIQLVSKEHQRMMDALREQHWEVQEAKVILVEGENRPGLLQFITEKLARENIDVLYLYATAVNVDKCLVVLSTANNEWAVMVLNS
ncbi:MAG: hypothetical protein ABSC89_13850 [Verrucomicrobiota bacterium]